MRIRIQADREPYASYADKEDPQGFFFFCRDGAARADLEVMPAERYLALAPGGEPEAPVFAYGPISLMAEAFAAGCRDYLREPWTLAELQARAERYARLRFLAGSRAFELRGRSLALGSEPAPAAQLSEAESRLLRLLVRNAGSVVTRRALSMELWGRERLASRAIDVHIGRLRSKFESIAPGSRACIQSCRGFGYRMEVDICG